MDDGIRRNKRRTSGMVPEVLLRGMVGIKGVIIFEGGTGQFCLPGMSMKKLFSLRLPYQVIWY